MQLPTKALRYIDLLRRRGLLRASILSAVEDVARFGVQIPIRRAFDVVGVENFMRIRFPGTRGPFRVRSSPFWKYWKTLGDGSHDGESLRFLSSFVRPGQTVLDVGAWEGPYTLLLADRVGGAGRVVAFEPDSRALALLRANVEANGLTNVLGEAWCLSDTEGTAPFFDSRGGTIGSLMRNELVADLPLVEVKTTTIDRYCRDHALSVDGMKIDVEGAEARVVAGGREVIARYAPWLFLEFHGVLMSDAEKRSSWDTITRGAQEMTFVWGKSQRYRSGDRLESYPDCDYFHVLIQY